MTDIERPEKRRRRRGAKSREIAEDGANLNRNHKRDVAKEKDAGTGTPTTTSAPISALRRKIEQAIGISATSLPVNANSDQQGKGKKAKKRKKGKAPKKGEEGYLTPSQMRNARKRRAVKREKAKNAAKQDMSEDDEGNPTKRSKKNSKADKGDKDPSMRYIKDPRSAPLAKKAKTFFKGMNIPFAVYVGELSGWRTVCKLPVRRANDGKKSCVIGLFRPGSHKIVKVPNCAAHHPSMNSTIEILQQECDALGIEPFNEFEGTGVLRYVCINVERTSGKVQLTLVWNSTPYDKGGNEDGKEALDKFTDHLVAKANQLQLHSLWVHFNSQWKHADNVFDYGSSGEQNVLWKHIHGPKHIVETLDLSQCPTPKDVKLHFPPNVFRQANLDAFTKIVIAVRKYIMAYNEKRSGNELPTGVELYGGVGTIGLNVCDLLSSFISSDENPYNKLCFEKAAKKMSSTDRDKCTYIPKNATDVIMESKVLSGNCEICIVDPPRKGLDEFVTQSFIDAASTPKGPQVLVYVSCGFDAFARDCDLLLKSSKWKLDKAEGHLLFPGSDAIETLAFFRRT